MTKVLNLDEMQEVLETIGHPTAAGFARALEGLGDAMASEIRNALNIASGRARCDGTAFAGTCVGFSAVNEDDPIPDVIRGYDEGADWAVYDGLGEVTPPDAQASRAGINA